MTPDERATARAYSREELFLDGIVHAAAVVAALVSLPILLTLAAVWDGHAATMAALGIYAASVLGMFGASWAYNHLRPGDGARELLRRLDHAAIYLKIAGTQTPFAVLAGGHIAPWVLLGVWCAAIAGAVAKLAAWSTWERLSVGAYLALGWAGIMLLPAMAATLSGPTLVLVVTGGVLYSVGVVFHLWDRLPYQNAIWHIFVVVATFVFYSALMVQIASGTT